jgi:hypothetical protein
MIYGEHLNANEQAIKCACGVTATVEVLDKRGCSCGWFCRRCAAGKRDALKRQEKLAKAIVRKNSL